MLIYENSILSIVGGTNFDFYKWKWSNTNPLATIANTSLSPDFLGSFNLFFAAHQGRNFDGVQKTPEVRPLTDTGLSKTSIIYKIMKKIVPNFCEIVAIFQSAEGFLYIIFENCIERSKFTKLALFSKWRQSFLVLYLELKQRTIPHFFHSYSPHPLTGYSKMEVF